MLIEKLAAGVVQVQTPIGPRYVMPSFLQRVYLLWMFRNFPILPHAVLSRRQQRLIDQMCGEQRFASMAYADGMDEAPVIGTIEHRPPVGADPLAATASGWQAISALGRRSSPAPLATLQRSASNATNIAGLCAHLSHEINLRS